MERRADEIRLSNEFGGLPPHSASRVDVLRFKNGADLGWIPRTYFFTHVDEVESHITESLQATTSK